MKLKSFVVTAAILSSLLSVARAASPVDTLRFAPTHQSVQLVLAGMFSRLGSDSLCKVVDRTSVGTITYKSEDSSVTGSVVMIAAAPNLKHDSIAIKGRKIQHIVDGTHAWFVPDTMKARAIEGKALASDLADAKFNPECHLLDSGVVVSLLGMALAWNGDSAYVLKVQFGEVPGELWYVSKRSALVVQRSQQSGTRIMELHYSDFRSVDGVTYPFHLDESGLQTFSIQFNSIKHNTHPPRSTFLPPSQ
jgi:hypothetical protein